MRSLKLLSTAFIFISCLASASAFAQGSPAIQCLEGLRKIAPEYNDDNLQWVCGLSRNTPPAVAGAGYHQDYVNCLLDSMRSDLGHKVHMEIVMNQCASHANERYEYTDYQPTALYCMSEMAAIHPAWRDEDVQWLCGISANTAVPGFGEQYSYVSCLIDSMNDPSNAARSDLLTQKCSQHADTRSAQTNNMPSALYCVTQMLQIYPDWREEDARWSCNISANSYFPGYGDRPSYVQCLVSTHAHYPSMKSQNEFVIKDCAHQSDAGIRNYPAPNPYPAPGGPIVIPNTPQPPAVNTVTCPRGYRWDANRQGCVPNDVRRR